MKNIDSYCKKLYSKIRFYFQTMDYDKVVELSELYLNIPQNSINPIIPYFYGVALLEMQEPNKAIAAFELSYQAGADSSILVSIGKELKKAEMMNESAMFLMSATNDPLYNDWIGFYLIGKNHFYNNLLDEAKKAIEKSIVAAKDDKSKVAKSKKILKKIEQLRAKEHTTALFQNLQMLKPEAQAGQIVYLKNDAHIISASRCSEYLLNRPYLIVHIEGDIAYGVSLTRNRNVAFIAQNNNPQHLSYITKDVVCFNKNDIYSVQQDATSLDYKKLTNTLYQNLINQGAEIILDEAQQALVQAINRTMAPEAHNIIYCYDKKIKKCRSYFITDFDEDYQAVEVEFVNGEFIPTTNYVSLPKETIINYKVVLNEEAVNKILSSINIGQGRH